MTSIDNPKKKNIPDQFAVELTSSSIINFGLVDLVIWVTTHVRLFVIFAQLDLARIFSLFVIIE